MSTTLANQLRQAIKASGLSGYAICKATGVNKAAFSRFMHGQRGLNLDSADAICRLLELEFAPKAKERTAKGARK